MSTFEQRYWSKVRKTAGCWLWTAALTKARYGLISVGSGRRQYAHRLAYEFAHGPLPRGAWVLHTCDNPPCVNPAHLFLGGQSENMADASRKGRVPHGEAHYQAKLTAADVIAIRALYAAGVEQKEIARRYGVIQQAVSKIIRRKSWAHIT